MKKNLKTLGRALRTIHRQPPLKGWASYGGTTKATLYVGATTGLRGGPVPEGRQLSQATVTGTIVGLRAEQVGPMAGATAVAAKGRYKGHPETSYKVEFFHDGSEPSVQKFAGNMKRLAQNAASALAQREIIVELQTDGKRTSTFSASPTRAPSPTSRAFCAWVRDNSSAAKNNPGDACYEAPKRKRRAR